jgi:hypothetical protein
VRVCTRDVLAARILLVQSIQPIETEETNTTPEANLRSCRATTFIYISSFQTHGLSLSWPSFLDIKRIVGVVDIKPCDCVIRSLSAVHTGKPNILIHTLLDLGFDALLLFLTGLIRPQSGM